MHSLTDEQLLAIIRENPVNRALLAVLATLDIPHCMLVAGACSRPSGTTAQGCLPAGASRTMTSPTLTPMCPGRQRTG